MTAATASAGPIVAVKPVVLPAPGRGEDLRVKVSAPVTGDDLPVLVFSHGFGQSMNGYGPLVDHWAAHGFVVLQATYLDSRTIGLTADDPRAQRVWRSRVEDARRVLDQLDVLEAAVPGLGGRLDHERIAAAGHSFGGHTTGALLGLRVRDPETGVEEDLSDPRVRAGVLLATAGRGGANLTPSAAERYPYMNPTFEHMSTPALVVAGDHDEIPRKHDLTVRGPEWMTEPYSLSPGRKSLLTLFGAEHSLGGITGYDSRETTDENHDRVSLLQRMTTAYLRHELGLEHSGWSAERTALEEDRAPLGRLESKG